MPEGLRGPGRRVRFAGRFPAAWITLVLALTIVAVAVPLRRRAVRTATEAWIPMRSLTPQEAAALLEHGAKLSRIGAGTVDLVTSVYLTPVPSSEGAGSPVRRGGRTWQPVSASWEGYSLRYRLDRAPLERELGGRPLTAFLDPGARKAKLSFRSERLLLYAAFEAALLWVALLLLWLIVRRLRPLPLVAPALLLLAFGFVTVVLWYSPALWDADWFFQRWAVEPIALGLVGISVPLLWAAAFSLVALLLVLLLQLVMRGKARPAQRIAVSWAPAVLLLLAGLAVHWRATATERRDLDAIAAALRFDDAGAVLGEARSWHRSVGDGPRLDPDRLPPHLRRFVADAFAAMPVVPGGSSTVLLPVEGGDWLLLWRRPDFTYLDFRAPISQIGQSGIDAMMATRRPYDTGFLRQLRALALSGAAERFSGRPLLDDRGRVRALVYVVRTVRLELRSSEPDR
jgi:hypothetical protein